MAGLSLEPCSLGPSNRCDAARMRTVSTLLALGSGTVIAGVTVIALATAVSMGLATSWDATWRSLGVTPLSPHFFDMHALTDHLACAPRYNAYELNECDPATKFNYPPIWLRLSYLGIDGSYDDWFSIISGACAFAVMAALFKGRSAIDGMAASLAIFSPSVMMGVERGNIDLVIFTLVGLAALTFKETGIIRSFLAALVVMLAVMLKLYPVFCIALVVRLDRRTIFFAIILVLGSIIYFYDIADYLPIIRSNTPTSFMLSYGYKVIFLGLDHLRMEAGHHALNLADGWLPIAIATGTLALSVAFGAGCALRCEPFCVITKATPGTAFLFGSGIYCGTYLLGTNFIYRLMFLLLCIPQIQDWTEQRPPNKKATFTLAYLLLTVVLLVLWANGNPNGHSTFVIIPQLLNWATFFGFVTILIQNFVRASGHNFSDETAGAFWQRREASARGRLQDRY